MSEVSVPRFQIKFIDSKVSFISGEIQSFTINSTFGDLPKFILQAELSSNIANIGPAEFILMIYDKEKTISFNCTSLQYESGIVQGYVISKASYFIRRSRVLSMDLNSSLRALNIKQNIDLVKLVSTQPFLQMNETDAECFKRIINFCGVGMLWGVDNTNIRIVNIEKPIVPVKTLDYEGKILRHIFNSSRSYFNDTSSSYGFNVLRNLHYRTENVAIPSTCLFSRDAVLSYLDKKKYKDWEEICLEESFSAPVGNLGDPFRITGFPLLSALFFISSSSITYKKNGTDYNYRFSNYSGWNAYG